MTGTSVVVLDALSDPARLGSVRELLGEYREALRGVAELCFGGFEAELAALPAPYSERGGLLLLATVAGVAAGMVGVAPLLSGEDLDAPTNGADGEVRRLFVRPDFRRARVGRALVSELLVRAFESGAQRLVLHTLPAAMPGAYELYSGLGFLRTPSSPASTASGVVWMAKELRT